MNEIVRQTRPDEFDETVNLTREAFWNIYHPGCDEHLVLRNFRNSAEYLPELDCVLETDGRIAAHIMYCNAFLSGADGSRTDVLMFGPISVYPQLQRKGYGSKIILSTLEKAAALGCPAVVITGNHNYYHRLGFDSCTKRGIYYEGMPHDDEAVFFMIKVLDESKMPKCECSFKEPDCYKVDTAELEEFEKQFPPKEKKVLPGQL